MKALKEFINEGNGNLKEIASITYKVETQIDYDVKKSDDKGATIFFDVNLYVTSGKNNDYMHGFKAGWEDIDYTCRLQVDLKYHEINEGQLNVFLVDDAKVVVNRGGAEFNKTLDTIYNLFHGSKNIDLAWYIDYRINHLIMHEISQSNLRLPVWFSDEINTKITKQFDNLFEV